MLVQRTATSILVLLLLLYAAGCSADSPANPSFPLTVAAAKAELAQMQESPRPASRPIIIIGGYADPGIIVSQLAAKLRRVLADETPIITVAPGWTWTMEDARRRLLDEVEAELARAEQELNIEIDVVAYSMGGLVARRAAMPDEKDQRRLSIVRLMTIATPHRGADWAQLPTLEDRVVDMRAGSAFLCALDECEQGFEVLPYCRLGDWIVGCENAAPPGRTAWWVPNQPLQFGHLDAHKDPRILADIARRLRGEEPFTTLPAADLPR
ncbi:MAG: hypothetical protein KF699_10005 [Phycisphaeraceae bacterium]|nr:hypothetical protein [Phycisphaeraceae bacterium]